MHEGNHAETVPWFLRNLRALWLNRCSMTPRNSHCRSRTPRERDPFGRSCRSRASRQRRRTDQLQSRVAPYYGDAIAAQAREMLETMGVKNAQVSIHDEGALPFVISARIEAAVNRSGLGAAKKILPEKLRCRRPPQRSSSPFASLRSRIRAEILHQRRDCMVPMPSSLISKILFILGRRTPPVFSSATHCAT